MLPTFLVIGAMKAGSTTLYTDLQAQAKIFLPEKELSYLNQRDILEAAGRAKYTALFEGAAAGQVVGDTSANYAKLPDDSAGTVERAAALLGDDFSVLYMVRDPVDRAVSHHHHELSRREHDFASIDDAVRAMPNLINYSRYGYQVRPWVELVGADRVRMIKLEDYRVDRAASLSAVLDFLDAGPVTNTSTFDRVHNKSEGLHVATGVRAKLTRSSAYRRLLRPWLPNAVRQAGRNALLTTAPPRPDPPSPETVDFILDAIRPDLDELARLGLESPPRWDLDATRARYAALASG